MDSEDVADVGIARVLAGDAGRIGGGGLELFPDGLSRLEQTDRVAQALRHLGLTVEPQYPLSRGEQRLGLREREVVREPAVPAPGDPANQVAVLELVFHRGPDGCVVR